MKAKLVTYTTEKLNKSEKSILSKRMYGYLDKSNKAQYEYKREGILHGRKYTKVCNNTFIIAASDWISVKKELIKRKTSINEWDIIIRDF